jgi:hypothetical protein
MIRMAFLEEKKGRGAMGTDYGQEDRDAGPLERVEIPDEGRENLRAICRRESPRYRVRQR